MCFRSPVQAQDLPSWISPGAYPALVAGHRGETGSFGPGRGLSQALGHAWSLLGALSSLLAQQAPLFSLPHPRHAKALELPQPLQALQRSSSTSALPIPTSIYCIRGRQFPYMINQLSQFRPLKPWVSLLQIKGFTILLHRTNSEQIKTDFHNDPMTLLFSEDMTVHKEITKLQN